MEKVHFHNFCKTIFPQKNVDHGLFCVLFQSITNQTLHYNLRPLALVVSSVFEMTSSSFSPIILPQLLFLYASEFRYFLLQFTIILFVQKEPLRFQEKLKSRQDLNPDRPVLRSRTIHLYSTLDPSTTADPLKNNF